jgi:hypothetical protein
MKVVAWSIYHLWAGVGGRGALFEQSAVISPQESKQCGWWGVNSKSIHPIRELESIAKAGRHRLIPKYDHFLVMLGGWDLAKRLERRAVNVKVATVLGSIPASSDTMESERRQMKQCWITYIKRKNQKNHPLKKSIRWRSSWNGICWGGEWY